MKRKLLLTLITGIFGMSFGTTAFAAPKAMPDGVVFDAEYYAQANPDVVAALGASEEMLYLHYTMFGKTEGRLPMADGTLTVSSGSLSSVPVSIEPGDVDYLKLGNHFYRSDEILEDVSAIPEHHAEMGLLWIDSSGALMSTPMTVVDTYGWNAGDGFVRADYSSDSTYCMLRDYLLLQIAQAGPGRTDGSYPDVFILKSLEESQSFWQVYQNLNVDLYKSGLVKSIYLDTEEIPFEYGYPVGFPRKEALDFAFYK